MGRRNEAVVSTSPEATKPPLSLIELYVQACSDMSAAPVRGMLSSVSNRHEFEFPADRPGREDWETIFVALRNDRSLRAIRLSSYWGERSAMGDHKGQHKSPGSRACRVPEIQDPEVSHALTECLSQRLSHPIHVTHLSLAGIPVRPRDARIIARRLDHIVMLHLPGCRLGDTGVKTLCEGIRVSKSIRTVDFSRNELTDSSCIALGALLTHCGVRRQSDTWQHSLRGRPLEPIEGPGGLLHINLSYNPSIGDAGTSSILHALEDDFWTTELRLRGCGLGDPAGRAVHALFLGYSALKLLDLADNSIGNHVRQAISRAAIASPCQILWDSQKTSEKPSNQAQQSGKNGAESKKTKYQSHQSKKRSKKHASLADRPPWRGPGVGLCKTPQNDKVLRRNGAIGACDSPTLSEESDADNTVMQDALEERARAIAALEKARERHSNEKHMKSRVPDKLRIVSSSEESISKRSSLTSTEEQMNQNRSKHGFMSRDRPSATLLESPLLGSAESTASTISEAFDQLHSLIDQMTHERLAMERKA